MPLIQSGTRDAVSENIRREKDAGKPQKQAVAIALDVARRNRAIGGPAPWWVRNEARGMMHSGAIPSIVPGRTDHHSMNVASGSYVMPADAISHLGQNNTAAGMAVLGHMFGRQGPYGMGTDMPIRGGAGAPRPPRMMNVASEGGPRGAGVGQLTPINAAGGEFVIPPEVVRNIGHGDVTLGHKILDHWVMKLRAKHIKTLKGLPPPAKS